MRNLEIEIFARKRVDIDLAKAYGFVEKDNILVYERPFMDDAFIARLTINSSGTLDCMCIDAMMDEVYEPVYISYSNGAYVSNVREAYTNILEEVREAVCVPLPFIYDQSNRIANRIYQMFHETPLPFSDISNEHMTFNNHENNKWYALVSVIEKSKLEGDSNRKVEIINVKLNPDDIERLLTRDGFYPAWHMNKKNWITIILDDAVSDDEIMDFISTSRGFTLGKKANKSGDEIHEWLIPSNPIYFDIVGAMEVMDEITWKQTSTVHVGDIVYLYVGKPYSAIMYKFEALEVDLHYGEGSERTMLLKKLASYDPHILTLSKMRSMGTNTPRGPRTMPKELIQVLESTKL